MKNKKISCIIGIIIISNLFIGCIEESNEVDKEKTYTEITLEFITHLSKNNYPQAYSFFNEDMKNAISLEYLEEIWEFYIESYGSFNEINQTRQTIINNYEVVFVNCTFENNYLIVFRVIFIQEKLIAGFWQDQIISLKSYQVPDYVNQSNFYEINITIGKYPWQLPATLTIPNGTGPFSSVILIHGSGPNDRDESIGPNKPFKDIAWGLASNDIVVLRYDKRTFVYPEEIRNLNNFTVEEEIIIDVFSAINTMIVQSYVPIKSIHLLGHSLGAMMIPKILSLNDSEITGAILLAPPARPLEDLILNQTKYLLNLDGSINASEQEIIENIEKQVEKIKSLNITENETLLSASKSYWEYLNTYNQIVTTQSIDIPMLFLQGKRDYQVTFDDDYRLWNESLKEKKQVIFLLYELLNHLFIPGQGTPSNTEYMDEGHVEKEVIEDITYWILSR
jgi:pimeloyl-ACP methyl ester carboxylesterase